MKIGVMGATGPAGGGLAARLASLGRGVVVGSRDPSRAETAVQKLRDRWGDRLDTLKPGANADAAAADIVVIAVPWDAAIATAARHAAALSGKVVIDMANGLVKEGREFRPVLPEEGSIAAAMQRALPESRVVAAFQHVPATAFAELDEPIESDVIVCGDEDDARRSVLELVSSIPNLRGLDAGSLANAVGIEAFAAVLLSVNLRHRGRASLRLLGVDGPRKS
jgi:NADPH-dependent F420 reductase